MLLKQRSCSLLSQTLPDVQALCYMLKLDRQ